jgi:hypothetical protein
MNINEITYDPSSDEILGVFGNKIHIKAYHYNDIDEQTPVILIISKKLFHKTWDNWINDKKEYCERYEEYCGIMGHTYIKEGEILDTKISLYEYEDDSRIEIFPTVIKVNKFYDHHDFEHG